jgi:hypothetical protein
MINCFCEAKRIQTSVSCRLESTPSCSYEHGSKKIYNHKNQTVAWTDKCNINYITKKVQKLVKTLKVVITFIC